MDARIEATDEVLIDRLKSNDQMAMTAIYKKYWEVLYLRAYDLFRDRDACEDVIQELFIDLWTRRNNLQITYSLKAYLFASMRYQIFRKIKSGSLSESLHSAVEERLLATPADQNLEIKELEDQVSQLVDSLSEKCRQVYKMSREDQLSHKEIASKLNISHKTVENHLRKALHVLRVSLGKSVNWIALLLLVE